MTRYMQIKHTAAATLVVFAMIAAVTAVGTGALVVGTQEATANHDSGGNYTVDLPDEDDHLPGDENPESASIYHLAAIDDGLEDAPADRYEALEWLVVSSDEIDFSACETDDTGGLGIDRGNNISGTQFDDDLLKHRKDSAFLDNKIWVQFYGEDDFGGDSVGITAEDEIVATQTDCYTMPEEPGWYQIDGKINGTGPDGEFFETSLTSHYFPICDGCHDEQTAEEKLGPAPSQNDGSSDGGDATPTPTPEPDDDATPTPEENDGSSDGGDATPTAESGGSSDGDSSDGGETTPTLGDGPGFTGLAALVALLGAALLARRR